MKLYNKPMLAKPTQPAVAREAGIVSFMVTLFIMLLLTLIVLGFAALTRREQRQALDDQLSTQAFYAAESGIDDAVKVIKSSGLNASYTTDCNGFINAFGLQANSNLDNATGVKYSCLLVDPALPTLQYDDISTNTSTVVPVAAQSGNIGKITISWQDLDPTNNKTFCPTVGQFTPVGSWPCTTGMLRVDIVPVTSLTRANLMANQATIFLYPSALSTKNPLTYNPSNDNGAIAAGGCSLANSPYCSVTIVGLNASQYYVRLKSIYRDTSVQITAKDNSASANPVLLVGAQVKIDATGKAQDILRRVQVRLPLAGLGPFPEFAIQSGDTICKRIQINSGVASNAAPGVTACDPFN